MRPQRAISVTVRRQPLQQLRSSRTHTLMQGEVGPDRAIRCRPPAPGGVELWGCVAYSSNDFKRPCPRATIPAGAAEFTLGGLQHEPIEHGSWRDHDRIRRRDRPVAADQPDGIRRTEPCPLAAHRVRRHVDRAAVLLQPGADPGSRGGGRRQGRPGRRGHHQVRGAARAALVPLGRARHLVHRRLVPRALGQLRGSLHARPGQRPDQLLPADHRHRRLARHDHAVQRLGADLAEPEEGARPRHRQ
jgi:hypothetical protein